MGAIFYGEFDGRRRKRVRPYIYTGWTRTRLAARVRETGKGSAVWKAGYAAPESAAWHSSLSPVLASLDLFDANYRTGQEITNELHLINDSWHDAKVHVDAAYARGPGIHSRLRAEGGFGGKSAVCWKLPQEIGNYWLTARTTGVPGRAVLSQRFVRALPPPVVSEDLKRREFVVLGSNSAVERFFKSRGPVGYIEAEQSGSEQTHDHCLGC